MQRDDQNHPSVLHLGSTNTNPSIPCSSTTTNSTSDSDSFRPFIFTHPCSQCGTMKRRHPPSSSPLNPTTKKTFIHPSSDQNRPISTISNTPSSDSLKSSSVKKSSDALFFNLGSFSGTSVSPKKVPRAEKKISTTTTQGKSGSSTPKLDENEKKKWKMMKENLDEMNKWVNFMIQEEEKAHPINPTEIDQSSKKESVCEENEKKEEEDRDGEENKVVMKVVYECGCGIKYQIGLGDLTLTIRPISSD